MCHNRLVMANIKSEDLRLSITVNGDAARKNIAEVERKIKDAEIALKSFRAEAKKKSTTKERTDEP